MGNLALAGAISGMGEGLGRGLFAMEQGFIQQGLMQEREKLEQARLDKTFAHAEGMEAMRATHAAGLQQERIKADREMNQERMGAGLVEKGMGIQGQKDMQATENEALERRTQTQVGGQLAAAGIQRDTTLQANREDNEMRTKIAEKEYTTKERIAEKDRRARQAEQQADIARDIMLARFRTEEVRGSGRAYMDPGVDARIKSRMEKMKGIQSQMEKGLLLPDELTAAKTEINGLMRDIDRLSGAQPEERPKYVKPSMQPAR
jgi:hypothetical protein